VKPNQPIAKVTGEAPEYHADDNSVPTATKPMESEIREP
jgi:hypothetical protein